MAPGVPFTFGPLLDSANASFPRLESAPRPVYVFDQTGSKTDTWHDEGLEPTWTIYSPGLHTEPAQDLCGLPTINERAGGAVPAQILSDGIKLAAAVARPTEGSRRTNYFEKGFRRKYALKDIHYEFFLAESSSLDAYKKACQRAIEKHGSGQKWDLAIVQIEESFHELPTKSQSLFRQ